MFCRSSGRNTTSSRQFFWHVFWPTAQRNSLSTNKSETKPTQITDAGNGPCYYTRTPCISMENSHSRVTHGDFMKILVSTRGFNSVPFCPLMTLLLSIYLIYLRLHECVCMYEIYIGIFLFSHNIVLEHSF